MRKVLRKLGSIWPVAMLALVALFGVTMIAFAQGTPFAQISASNPAGAFNIFPFTGGASWSGTIPVWDYDSACTPAAATTCTATANPSPFPAGAPTPAATPFCYISDAKGTAGTYVIGAQHTFNATWNDTPTLIANASSSNLLHAHFKCETQ